VETSDRLEGQVRLESPDHRVALDCLELLVLSELLAWLVRSDLPEVPGLEDHKVHSACRDLQETLVQLGLWVQRDRWGHQAVLARLGHREIQETLDLSARLDSLDHTDRSVTRDLLVQLAPMDQVVFLAAQVRLDPVDQPEILGRWVSQVTSVRRDRLGQQEHQDLQETLVLWVQLDQPGLWELAESLVLQEQLAKPDHQVKLDNPAV